MNKKVLVGHPDKHFRYDIHKAIKTQKFTVIEADNGGALFTITKTQQPDLVVMAEGLSSMSTEEYLKKLREINLSHIPIIILTLRKDPLRNLALLELGAKEIMVEPIREAELLFHVKRLLNPFTISSEGSGEAIEVAPQGGGSVRRPSSEPASSVLSVDSQSISVRNTIRAENSSLLLRQAVCQMCQSKDYVKLFVLKTRTVLTEIDKFDIEIYKSSIGHHQYCDYRLLEVAVCSTCFFASRDHRMFNIQGNTAEETMVFSEFVGQAFLKSLNDRVALAKKISPKFFSEHRSPSDAIIAFELNNIALEFLFKYDKLKYSWAQNEIFQNLLTQGAIADNYNLGELRNKKYLEAFTYGQEKMALKGELGLRRHTFQMLALSCLVRDKDLVYKYGKDLWRDSQNIGASPQIRIKTREYVDRAKADFGWIEDENYWKA